MNQILVSEKLYVTPELKKKKKLYKFNFIVSIMLVIILFSYYVYAEYDRTASDKSEQILSQIEVVEIPVEEDKTIASAPIKLEDDILVVILDDENDTEEINLNELIEANQNAGSRLDAQEYTTDKGASYTTVAVVEIPKINITYPVIYSDDTSEQTVEDLLKISVVKYWGPEANQPGNFCIVGHNYHNKRFFSKAATLENGDSIYITDTNNETLEYKVYANYVVEPDDLRCTSQLTNGATDITLITCTMTGKQRTIIKARAINAD